MSLQTLLAQYPNFSVRRIRKLATQLQFLESLNSSEAKGIATDLMALTMQAAKTEAQLSDVAQIPGSENTQNVVVVPSTEAIKAINGIQTWIGRQVFINQPTQADDIMKTARDIVHDSSFVVHVSRPKGEKV